MIKPLQVWWTNFFSYGNDETRINLNFSKPTLIIGKNLDATIEGQVDSNGSGKSVLINAIAYVMYDRTVGGKIKVDKLINNINKKNLLVGFSFERTVGSTTKYYFVERWRKNKARGPDGILIKENTTNDYDTATDITQDSIVKANKQLEDIIGHSFDVFSRICLYSSSQPSFFSLPITSTTTTNRSDIIEELFSLTDLSKDAEILKEEIKANKSDLNMAVSMNEQIIGEHTRHQDQLKLNVKEFDDWTISHDLKLRDVSSKIDHLSKVEFDGELILFKSIKDIQDKQNELNSERNSLTTILKTAESNESKYNDFENNKVDKLNDYTERFNELKDIPFEDHIKKIQNIKELEQQVSDFENMVVSDTTLLNLDLDKIKKLEGEIEHLKDSKCPYCSQAYEESKIKLEEKSQILDDLCMNVSQKKIIIENNNTSILDIKKLIDKTKVGLLNSRVEWYMNNQNEFNSLSDKIEDLKKSTNPHKNDEISKDDINSKIKCIDTKLDTLNKKYENYSNLLTFKNEREMTMAEAELKNLKVQHTSLLQEVNPYKKILDRLNEVKLPEDRNEEIQTLTDTLKHQDFLYKLLTDKNSFIRKALISKNLEYLNTRFQHYLKKIGLPHKVILNFDMSTTISEFNNEIDYENLSTGQKARINIALSFAFRDVLQKRHGKITFTILDECLDSGLGNIGVQMTVKMIKEVVKEEGISMFVISHRDETTTMFDSKLEIEKNNKFSSIVHSDI